MCDGARARQRSRRAVASPLKRFSPPLTARSVSMFETITVPLSLGERLRAAAAAMRAGRPVLLTDDGDRENEADLIVAADLVDVATMALLIRDGSGIVCLCLPAEDADRLRLAPMTAANECR